VNRVEVGSYEFDVGSAREKLAASGVEKILLQIPDGFKIKADVFMDFFDQDVIIWGGSCYGACDLPKDIGCADALLHVGHAEIPNVVPDYPVVYLEGRCRIWNDLPNELLKRIDGKVALYAPVQHIHQIEKAAEQIRKNNCTPIIGDGDKRIKYPGQILGCNYSVKEDADHHLYIGTGRFHPLGLSFSLGEEVWIFDPVTDNLDKIGEEERDAFLRKRYGMIAQALESEKIMVMVSTKPGQYRERLAKDTLARGREVGKNMLLTRFDEMTPKEVDQFRWDCAVCTACPRIVLDDGDSFRTIMLTPEEFKIALNLNEEKDWTMDEITKVL